MTLRDETAEKVNAEIEEEQHIVFEDRVRAQHDLLKTVSLGKECSQFLATGVGAFILDRAIEGREAALESLSSVDSKDSDKIHELQREANVPAFFFTWLNEAIMSGVEAGEQINLDMEDDQDA